jgi:hypothetical protein
MAYIINKFNGTQLLSVEDGTVDNTTDIKFVGKNYSGYGEIQNENMLHLMEHFAGTAAPTKAIPGQIWFDSSLNKLKFYTGANWKATGGAQVSATEPTGLTTGDLWFKSDTNQIYVRTAADEFELVGPQAAGSGTTQLKSVTVQDNGNVEHAIVVALVEDNAQFIISDSEFTLKSSQAATVPVGVNATNFPKVKKGITLLNTSTLGITTDAGQTDEPVIWGTASDALRLGGILASDYITVNDTDFTSLVTFADAGFKVGDDRDLAVKIVDGNIASIQNEVGEEIRLGAKLTTDPSPKYLVKIINSASEKGLLPYAYDAVDTSLQYNLGSSTLKWNEIHGVSFKGTADQANLLQVGSAYRSASNTWTDASQNDTVAVRDSSGNIVANEFTGVASRARYADLAEKYTTGETELPAGTAVAVGADDCCEVVPAKSSDICIGVVSTDPAYMMNSEAEGQYIGLKGRVPVRVKGAVKKGQAVYAWEDGVCSTIQTTALVGVALESNSNEEEKLVECVLKT